MRIKNLAFTLAEIMIVLVVIGILTGILVPAAMNSMPNGNVMKFKKAHNTLYRVINELVSSDKYYADGDLGIRPNGDLIDGTHSGDYTYFCNSIADVLSAKLVNCSSCGTVSIHSARVDIREAQQKEQMDNVCSQLQTVIGAEITTTDNIVYYQTTPKVPFGALGNKITWGSEGTDTCSEAVQGATTCATRLFNSPVHTDQNGFNRIYKIFCIDVDGISNGEAPFGYGIRYDGKIWAGERADKWLEKSIQEKE